MTKTRSVEEFETSLVQLYYKSDILFKYGASRNFEWNRKRELEWDRIYTVLRKLHSKEISKIQTVFQLKTKIWKLIQMTKKKYQRHLLFPAYPKSFSKVEKLILKYEGIAMNGLPQTSEDQIQAPQSSEKENDNLKKSKEKVEYWLSYKFILPNHSSDGTASDTESLSSPTSLFYIPNNPFDPTTTAAAMAQHPQDLQMQQHQFQQQQQQPMEQQQHQQHHQMHQQYYSSNNCDTTSTQQLLDSETLGNETEEKLVLCNTNDNQLGELLQILKDNERQNAEINALRLEREKIELEEAKIRLTLAEEEAARMSSNNNNNNINNSCHLQLLGA